MSIGRRLSVIRLNAPRFSPTAALLAGALAMLLFTGHRSLQAENSAAVLADPVAAHHAEMVDWRAKRDARLRSESGWLTLVGLDWLKPGENRVGSDPAMDIVLPGGPAYWGTIMLEGDQLHMRIAEGAGVTVAGRDSGTVPLIADNAGEPTVVQADTLSFLVIYRESYGLRVKDAQAPTRVNFAGIDNYDIDFAWRFDGRFIPAQQGETIEIGNVLGQIIAEPVYGRVEFEVGGQLYSVLGLGDQQSESLYIVFADKTAGRETYGGGRMLYSDGLPEDGRVVIDFNKAYNPPCAFTEYSTCSLPPQENRFPFAIRAGEKKYH